MLPVTLLYSLTIIVHLYFYHLASEAEIEAQMHDEVVHFAREIDNTIYRFTERIRSHTELLNSMDWPEPIIFYVLQQMIDSDPMIRGISLSHSNQSEHYNNTRKTSGFIKKNNELSLIESIASPPAFLKHNTWEELTDKRKSMWTPAYFDKNFPEKICSYVHSFDTSKKKGFFKLDVDIESLIKKYN